MHFGAGMLPRPLPHSASFCFWLDRIRRVALLSTADCIGWAAELSLTACPNFRIAVVVSFRAAAIRNDISDRTLYPDTHPPASSGPKAGLAPHFINGPANAPADHPVIVAAAAQFLRQGLASLKLRPAQLLNGVGQDMRPADRQGGSHCEAGNDAFHG